MEALKEALKELLRVVFIAVIPLAIDGLSTGNLDPKLLGITAIIAALRFLDKFLHETGKNTGNETLEKGLTRF